MKKIIATWIYLDNEDEKSYFPQMGGDSSNLNFQKTYWKCVACFFATSLRYNKEYEHYLFTNSTEIPSIDGFNLKKFFEENHIKVIQVKNLYKLPKDYYKSFNNQFYEFSIIDYLSKELNPEDSFLLLDSDCIFTKSASNLFDEINSSIAGSYVYPYSENVEINGITRIQMKKLFNELGIVATNNPFYCAGEILLCNGEFLQKIAVDFTKLFPILLSKHKNDKTKFNEEAHVLTYFYYKYNAKIGNLDKYIKRIWTDSKSFRNTEESDFNLTIWHLPAEKKYGFNRLFKILEKNKTLIDIDEYKYQKLIYKYFWKKRNILDSAVKFLTK